MEPKTFRGKAWTIMVRKGPTLVPNGSGVYISFPFKTGWPLCEVDKETLGLLREEARGWHYGLARTLARLFRSSLRFLSTEEGRQSWWKEHRRHMHEERGIELGECPPLPHRREVTA